MRNKRGIPCCHGQQGIVFCAGGELIVSLPAIKMSVYAFVLYAEYYG